MNKNTSIFDEEDAVSALRAWIRSRPGGGRGELKLVAEKLRINSSVLSQIMSGLRTFSEDHAFLLSSHMNLSPLEQEYFICLVQVDRASLQTYKDFLQERLQALRDKSKNLADRLIHEKVVSEKSQAEFYSSWLYSAIRLRTSIGNGVTLEDVCKEFSLEKAKAHQILDFLATEGLIMQNSGVYTMGPSRTHLGKNSPYNSRHLTNWRIRAIERAQFIGDDELMFSGPLTISRKDYLRLKEKMMGMIQEVSNTVKDSPSETMACFNLDFIYIK